MKKLTAILLTAAIAMSFMVGATTETDKPQYATMDDALAVLRECVKLPNVATVATHDFNKNEKLDIGDGLLVLRGLVGIGDKMVMGESIVEPPVTEPPVTEPPVTEPHFVSEVISPIASIPQEAEEVEFRVIGDYTSSSMANNKYPYAIELYLARTRDEFVSIFEDTPYLYYRESYSDEFDENYFINRAIIVYHDSRVRMEEIDIEAVFVFENQLIVSSAVFNPGFTDPWETTSLLLIEVDSDVLDDIENLISYNVTTLPYGSRYR